MCENFKIYGNVLLVIMWAYTSTNLVMFSKTLIVGAEEGEIVITSNKSFQALSDKYLNLMKVENLYECSILGLNLLYSFLLRILIVIQIFCLCICCHIVVKWLIKQNHCLYFITKYGWKGNSDKLYNFLLKWTERWRKIDQIIPTFPS